MLDLESLNTSQKDAVLHHEGPLMILAGAGSGKTKTLVSKIAYLIDVVQYGPYQVLALTFSNKAAKEMRDRVSQLIKADLGAIQITTFHAFCARLLRSEASYIGLSKNFTIYDKSESKVLAKNILGRHGISPKEVSPFELLYFIDELKNNGHYSGRESLQDEIDTSDPFYKWYLEYEEELRKSNAMDFGGLITAVIELFEKFPEVRERYEKRFKAILVDEYQDTNRAQFELIKFLRRDNKNICVVGDEDQSIYSWRGADIRNILEFEDFFPDVELIKLEQNYRSSKSIIDAASAVIAQNTQRKGKVMWTENEEGDVIKIIECESDREEADFIVKKIKELHSSGEQLTDMAVFYRTNAQARILEDYFRSAQVPYRVVGGIKFYERKEIKDLIAYLRLVVNPKDSLSFARIINTPTRGVGLTSLRKLETKAVEESLSLYELARETVQSPEKYTELRLTQKVKYSLNLLIGLIEECRFLEESGENISLIYEKLLMESGYWADLNSNRDYESQARMENLEEFKNALIQFEENTTSNRLSDFLETITLDVTNEENQLEGQAGEVSLMTIHGAKGLEFEYVFVAGLEEKVFPSYRSIDEGGTSAIEEERRLFYVAMTRAMKELYLCFAQGRMIFGEVRFNGPSRFLHEIPEKYFVWMGSSGESRQNWSRKSKLGDDDFDFNQETYHDEMPVYSVQETKNKKGTRAIKFSPGTKVKHGLYGRGKVVQTSGHGDDEKVTIRFEDGEKKKFMVKFAPIEHVQ